MTSVRYPLAYDSQDKAVLKNRRIKVDWAELEVRGAGAAARTGIAQPSSSKQLPLIAARLAGKVRRTTIRARTRQTKAAAAAWGDKNGTLEGLEMAFWGATMGDRAWRRLDPLPLRYELSYRDKIEELQPDLIHAHDYRMIGVAARRLYGPRGGP